MSPYLIAGIIAAAILQELVPTGWIHSVLGTANPAAVPVATLVGAPIYLSVEAMLPLAASLADHGIPLGTVLAFVIGGAGVSLPNLILLGKFFDRTLLVAYMSVVVIIGVAIGAGFNIFM